MTMLRVAIIGCGKIADQHILALQRIPGCGVVAVCDRERLMAEQLAERFRIPGVFADVAEMLREAKPQVVHITTPPQSHHALARQCLDAGCHVYLEKPFTVMASEAEDLLAFAQERGRLVAAGHNYQFTGEMLRMRRLVKDGFLGGAPVHLESHWSYDLGDTSYVGPVLGSRNHWVRQLPGQLLHNILSHGIARLAEFLDDEVEVVARAHQSDQLRALGGAEVVDELRVLLRDGRGVTAFFCFSTQIKPGLSQFRICGPRQSLLVDQSSGSLIRLRAGSHKSYLTFLIPPLRRAGEWLANSARNFWDCARGELYQDCGMKELIARFYAGIETQAGPPIPYREIVLTARIMDEIFRQVAAARPSATAAPPPVKPS
jgi:predicted dehydrogenase